MVAKIGFDTTENEPSEVWYFWLKIGVQYGTVFYTESGPCTISSSAAKAASTVATLVERYDTVSFSDFAAKPSNFRGLVLGCIGTDFCN